MLESPKRLALEAVPVAVILLFWNLLAVVAQLQNAGGAVGSAGVVMAALFVVLRGVSLSSEVLPPATDSVTAILYQNARLALPAGAWFVGAVAVYALDGATYAYGPSSTASALASSLTGAGLGVVGLYAVAAGHRALLGDAPAGGRPPVNRDGVGSDGDDESPSDGASADD
ncbi:hypothetical protein M0R89_19935 (plasmid) [Halorussus limi]|uniref:Uncharacterized protein n=1 Tax=Halorussus limi TaxID=2938695 RepID=A0A8U0I0Y6_9EURY|nr:hypothetical protein [Halorussus limi]UPV76434.1 hypothetical protein M0R89_19935 [Halorussus limi]